MMLRFANSALLQPQIIFSFSPKFQLFFKINLNPHKTKKHNWHKLSVIEM